MGKDQELLDASRSGNIQHVGKLLEQIAKRNSGPLSSFRRSPSINGTDMNGYTPLHHACLNGHSNIVRLLLANDALSDLPDIRGSTPLYLAAWAGHQDIVKMLLMHPRRPSNPNAQTTDNETPLHCAAQHGHNTVLAILLSYGGDPTIRNNSFQTPLDLAAQFGRLQAVQILLRTHPELIEPYRSTTNSTFDLTDLCLPHNFAATSPTKHIFTHTCLHLASRNGHKKVVDTLLAAGVDVNILTNAGSALHEASLCGKKSVVTTLLEAGINPYAKDGNGRTALDLLKDYPPHVTYEISTAIEDFCKNDQTENHFKPIDENGIDDQMESEFFITSKNDTREKSHSIPKSAYIKKLNDHAKSINNSPVGLSSSLTSLPNLTTVPENYIMMRPIVKYVQQTSDIIVPKNRNHVEEVQLRSSPNSVNGKLAAKEVRKNTKSIESKDSIQMKNEPISEPVYTNTRYQCVDEYVKMTNPNRSSSNASTPDKDSAKFTPLKGEDYVNLKELKNEKLCGSSTENRELSSPITPINHLLRDANNNKHHSPTPDFPPPTVSQAENAILEFIHPPRPTSKKPNKRRSIHIECGDNPVDELESFIMEQISKDDNDDDDDQLSTLLRSKKSIPNGTSANNSRSSDCVEEFVSDVPFAGLFKGSTLNLASDEMDGFVHAPTRLRSPSLVRSVKLLPTRKSVTSPVEKTKGVDEDFNAAKVWEEINTILASIDNEMRENDEYDNKVGRSPHEEKFSTLELPQKNLATPRPIKIRNPSELLLGMKSNSSAKWIHSPSTLINGQVIYEVYYLGSTVIRELQGTISTRKSIQKLKRGETPLGNDQDKSILENCNTSTKYLKATNKQSRLQVGIAVSHVGVRFIDVTEKSTICLHDIQNINCVCQDVEDLRYFAYVTKEQELHYCHVFMVDDLDLATEIILTLGQAFEVAYQLTLVMERDNP